MADDHANKNRVDNNSNLDEDELLLDAAIADATAPTLETPPEQPAAPAEDAAAAEDDEWLPDPAEARTDAATIAVAMDEAHEEGVQVNIEISKRRALGIILELLPQFDPKEVKAIVKADRIRRKVARIQAKQDGTVSGILRRK